MSELIEKKRYVLYIDLDGVLTDFKGAFSEVTDVSSIKDPKKYADKYGNDVFFALLKGYGSAFWRDMGWHPDGKKIWSYVKYKNPIILSTPIVGFRPSYEGKVAWIRQHLGNVEHILSENKEQYATDNAILIDDFERNTSRWVAAGGVGIIHRSAAETIAKLKELGI